MSVTVVDDDIVQARPPRCSRCNAPIIGMGNIGGRCHNTEACKRRRKTFPLRQYDNSAQTQETSFRSMHGTDACWNCDSDHGLHSADGRCPTGNAR